MDFTIVSSAITYAALGAGIGVVAFIYVRHRAGTLTAHTLKKLVVVLAGVFACAAAAQIAAHYIALARDPFGATLLPPYQPWNWFIRTAFSRYLFPFFVSLAAGAFMYAVAVWINKFFNGELFAEEDKYLFMCAALVVGWPQFVLYLGVVVVFTVFFSGVASLRHGADTRIVLTDALLFAIPVVLLFGGAVAPYLGLWRLTIFA